MVGLARSEGFTLIELVTVMILVGILAVAVIPRFADRATFDSRGFYDQTKAALQFARKAAVAQRRTVCVTLTAAAVTATIASMAGGACDSPLVDPSTGNGISLAAPDGVTLTAAAITFDALGSATPGAVITVAGGVTSTITVEAHTGYVY